MTSNIALHVALGSGIIFTKFDLRQLKLSVAELWSPPAKISGGRDIYTNCWSFILLLNVRSPEYIRWPSTVR